MKAAKQQGQGALEYLLLIGGAVVVAVVVIYIMIGLAGSSGNSANTTVQTGIQHIQGALGGNGGGEVELCGNGIVDADEECDCGGELQSCTQQYPPPLSDTYTCSECKIL